MRIFSTLIAFKINPLVRNKGMHESFSVFICYLICLLFISLLCGEQLFILPLRVKVPLRFK